MDPMSGIHLEFVDPGRVDRTAAADARLREEPEDDEDDDEEDQDDDTDDDNDGNSDGYSE